MSLMEEEYQLSGQHLRYSNFVPIVLAKLGSYSTYAQVFFKVQKYFIHH